jgi:soluble lytic murein transglycosylase
VPDTAWRIGFALAAILAVPSTASSPTSNGAVQAEVLEQPWHVLERLRPALDAGDAGTADLLRAADAELRLGRPERSRRLLETLAASDSSSLTSPAALRLFAESDLAAGRPGQAALVFANAARAARGREKGILLARAADGHERAGLDRRAATYYRSAALLLPEIAGWLAVREAGVTTDPVRAEALLTAAPPAAATLAARARAATLLAAGEIRRAAAVMREAGDDSAAIALSLAGGDSSAARRYAARALQDGAAPGVRLALAVPGLLHDDSVDRLSLARAHRAHGDPREAVRLIELAVAEGDTSPATIKLLGDARSAVGQRAEALSAYARAAARGGVDAGDAVYARARLLMRMGRREEGWNALLAFAETHADHPRAALAVYLVADARQDQRRRREAEALYASIAARWPTEEYAGRARLRLAELAVAKGDPAGARQWYQDEIAARGPHRRAAQYFLGAALAEAGDSAAALRAWRALAYEDSIGYYGTVTRTLLGLPLPVLSGRASRALPGSALAVSLDRLDLLVQALPGEEAEALAAFLAHQERPVQEQLALAHALNERGFMVRGVALGWRAAERHTLHDRDVLEAVFPWPFRGVVRAEARKLGLDPYLLAAVIRQESMFRPDVTSRAGARGLMQLMPGTAAQTASRLGVAWDEGLLAVADANLHIGAAYLGALLRQYDGEVVPALAAYNAGGRPVARWLRYPEASDPARFVERIPYVETRGYLRSVLRNRALYAALYPGGAEPSAGAP